MTKAEREAEHIATEILDYLEMFGVRGAEELAGEMFSDRQIGVTATERADMTRDLQAVLTFVATRLES